MSMSWVDILTDEEVAEIVALLDSDGGVEIEAPLIEDEDAWAFADMD